MIDTGILETGFPHSSRAGYEQGCKGKAYPGKADNGLSCADAVMRESGDYGFRKLILQGMTAVEAAAIIDAAPVVSDPRPALPKAAPKKRQPIDLSKLIDGGKRRVDGNVHGSTGGYKRGCRDDCPNEGVEGYLTCRTAATVEYQAWKTRRRARLQAQADAA